MKHSTLFSISLIAGTLILIFGIYLLIFMQYHERAYIFLGTGAGCLIGGVAGIITAQSKIKAAVFYGVMALAIMMLAVGVNYLTYNFVQYQERGYAVIAVGTIVLLIGIVGAIVAQPRARIAACFSVIELGIVASTGIVVFIIGCHLLTVYGYQKDAYTALAIGTVCFFGGIASAAMTQNKVAVQQNNV